MKKTDGLAKQEPEQAGIALPQAALDAYRKRGGGQANLADIKNPYFRISIAGSRFQAGDIALGNKGVEFEAHIIHVVPVRGYYKEKFEPGKPTPPDCASIGGIAPDASIETKQSTMCATCLQNRWGTGKDQQGQPSKGKACRESKRLVLWVPGVQLPCLLSMPPTSHRYLEDFLRTCTIYPGTPDGVPACFVRAAFSFVPGNYPHPKVEHVPGGLVTDPELIAAIDAICDDDAYTRAANAFSSEDAQEFQDAGVPTGAVAAVDAAPDGPGY